MKARSPGVCALALAAAVLIGAGAGGRARAEVVERVIAVVNEDAIFLSELRRRAAPFLAAMLASVEERERSRYVEQLYKELLDRLVEERLVEQEATRLQLRVTPRDVDVAVRNVAQANDLSVEQFWDAVRSQGFTEAQYRADIRRQLLRMKVINQRARERVNVTEADVRRRYDRDAREASRRLSFRLAQIYFPVPADATATDVAAIRDAAAARAASVTPATFFDEGGVDLGLLEQGDLPPELENAVLDAAPGSVVGPVRGPGGFHVLLLVGRELGDADVTSYEAQREAIYQAMLEEAMARQSAQILDELRKDAVVEQRL